MTRQEFRTTGVFVSARPRDVPAILCSVAIWSQSPSERRLDVTKRFSEEKIIGFLREAEAGIRGNGGPETGGRVQFPRFPAGGASGAAGRVALVPAQRTVL